MNRPVMSVSFPRSGHHLLMNLLLTFHSKAQQLFDHEGMSVHDTMKTLQGAGSFYYCEKNRHCKQTPCSDPRTIIQKEHDWNGKLPYDSDTRYLIMFRDPIASITSLFRGADRHGEATEQAWTSYAVRKMVYWKRWVQKWVAPRHKNALYIRYEDLVTNPLEYLRAAIEWISPGLFHAETAAATLALYDISVKNRVEQFRWYNSQFNDSLRLIAEDELAYLRGAI